MKIGKVGGVLVAAGLGLALAACGPVAGQAHPSTGARPSATTPPTTVPPPAGNASEPVFVEMDPAPAAQRPAEFDIYNHTNLTGLTWSGWGGPTARGAGTLNNDDCDPDCADGHPQTFPATIVLRDIQTVNGQREYTRFTVTFTGQQQDPDLAKALTDQPTNPSHQ